MLDWLLLRGSLIALCILANSFFVAAEFALVTVRETRIQDLLARKRPSAETASRLKHNIDEVLPAVQLGVTLANLVLGGLGEPALASGIERLLQHESKLRLISALSAHPAAVAHTLAIPLAFGCITYLEVVIGEIVPKSLALQRAERIALAVAGPVDLFIRITRPVVRVLNGSAAVILRLFRAPLRGEAGAHSPEELKLMASATRKVGLLPEFQEEIIHRALELREVSASEIMTPRTRIFALPAAHVGNAYTSGLPTVPRTLRDAREAFTGSTLARAAFGDEVVDHYTTMADVELAAFDAAVTDWELRRSFERM